MLKRLYDWLGKKVHSPYAVPFLALLFFVEAIFFLPVDPILILYCMEYQKRSLYFALVATVSSVLGGIMGYAIGAGIWETVGQKLVTLVLSPETFEHAVEQFKTYQSWTVLVAGFTPLPYKAITLAAGFCKLPLIPFVVNSLIARGARFFLIAVVISIWGKQMKQYIDRYFNILVLLFVIMIGASFWIFLK